MHKTELVFLGLLIAAILAIPHVNWNKDKPIPTVTAKKVTKANVQSVELTINNMDKEIIFICSGVNK